MQNLAEELRQRAQAYRQAADKGPKRERAQHLTLAYCLERQANNLERAPGPDILSFVPA
jgi:hypothetical protein